MNTHNIGLFAIASLVLVASVAVANHLPAPPPLSQGGELAYIRDHPDTALSTVEGTDGVRSAYVAFGIDPNGNETDRVREYTSRGRMADQEIFHQIVLPDGMLTTDRCFHAVQDRAHGAMVAESTAGRMVLFNAVNAGLGIQAKDPLSVVLQAAGGTEVRSLGPDAVALEKDGHAYRLDVHRGTIEVNGMNLVVALDAGGLLTGAIGGYPATTQVTGYELAVTAGAPQLC